MSETHSVWIGSKLGLMEKLTLQLLLDAGHSPILWTTENVVGVPRNVEIRKVPKDYIQPIGFQGHPHTGIPNGGIGSFAHWSDYFAFKTLYENGGIWVQMDVAVTKKIIAEDYTFTPWLSMVSPVVMAIPKGSFYALEMSEIIGGMLSDGMVGRDWHDAMIAMIHGLQRSGIHFKTFWNYYDCGGVAGSPYTHPSGGLPYDIIHWSNATHNTSKETPTKGSEYERLCKRVLT
jgi:hypothetical protein